MRTIAVVNQKGGAGKTTTAVHLAAALGEAGASVLVVDLDPQTSATAWFGLEGGRAMLDVFTGDDTLDGVARKTEAPGVEVAPTRRRRPGRRPRPGCPDGGRRGGHPCGRRRPGPTVAVPGRSANYPRRGRHPRRRHRRDQR